MAYQLTTAKIWDGAAWQDALGGGFVAAVTSDTETGTYTDGNGVVWNYHTFTGNGTFTVTEAGWADILVVGGGASGNVATNARGAGGAGGVRYGMFYLPAAAHSVTVGAGGSGSDATTGVAGSSTSFGTILTIGGGGAGYGKSSGSTLNFDGWGGGGSNGGQVDGSAITKNGGGAGGTPNNYDGLTLNYTGSAIVYGQGGTATDPLANAGWGGNANTDGGAGSDGVVIVKVLA